MNREYAKMSVGDGWHNLVDEAFDLAEKENFSIDDVKEKYGMLRIYTDRVKEAVYKKIADLEIRSMTICECCGAHAGPRSMNGWSKTICDPCKHVYTALAKA